MSSHLNNLHKQFEDIYATRIITNSEEEWLRIKHSGLGGTDKAIIAGISTWTTPVGLFYEKIEKFKYEDRPFNITMARGKALEPLIIELYTKEYDLDKVWHNKDNDMFRHKDYDYMLCTPDGLGIDKNLPQVETCECKSGAGRGSHKWIQGIPEQYLVQLQSNMDVIGLDYGCLYWMVDDIPGNIRVQRDKELCDALNYMAERFWNDNVLADIPPTPQSVDDFKKIYRTCVPQSILQCTEALYETINEYQLTKEMLKDYDEQSKLLKSREQELYGLIRKGMRDNEILEYLGEIIATLKLSKNGVRRLVINNKILNSLKENNHESN